MFVFQLRHTWSFPGPANICINFYLDFYQRELFWFHYELPLWLLAFCRLYVCKLFPSGKIQVRLEYFEEEEWLFFNSLVPNVSIIRGSISDERGNISFEQEGAYLGAIEMKIKENLKSLLIPVSGLLFVFFILLGMIYFFVPDNIDNFNF